MSGQAGARPPARRRDPEGRRQALAAAALETIAEVGTGRTTHRAVATRAGVPLGATTYYFPTLNDMVTAGLEAAAEAAREELRSWAVEIRETDNPPRALVRLVEGYFADRRQAVLEYELYLAAARDQRLRPLARLWRDGVRELLAPLAGKSAAGAAAALIDGAIVQALATGEDLDTAGLEAALRCLIGGSSA